MRTPDATLPTTPAVGRRPCARAAILVAILLGLGLRLIFPGADPPRFLTSSHAPVVDGPWYLARVVDRAKGDDSAPPSQYARAGYEAFAATVYRIAGLRLSTLALPSVLAWLGLAIVTSLGARRVAGGTAGVLVALLLAWDSYLLFYGRTPVIYTTVAFVEVLAVGLAGLAAGARGVRRVALASLALLLLGAAALALKPVVLLGAVPVLVLLGSGPAEPAVDGASRSAWRNRLVPIAAAIAALAAVLVATGIGSYIASRVTGYAGGAGALSPAEVLHRLLEMPPRSRLLRLAPVGFCLAIASPALLLREAATATKGALERALDRAALAWLGAGVLALSLHHYPDTPYALAFAPATAYLAAQSLRAIALGGRARGVATRAWSFVVALALTALFLNEAIHLLWSVRDRVGPGLEEHVDRLLGDWAVPFTSGVKTLRLLGAGVAAGALAGGLAALRARRGGTVPARPRLAAGLAGLHILTQVAWFGAFAFSPAYSVRAAIGEVGAVLPGSAVLGEQFAHALTTVPDTPARRYFVVEADAPDDPHATARSLGVTHLACSQFRYGTLVRTRFDPGGDRLLEVGSVYVRGARVRLLRIVGTEAAASPGALEGSRRAASAGDPGAARTILEAEAARLARSGEATPGLLLAELGLLRLRALELGPAREALEAATATDPYLAQAQAALGLIALRQGRPEEAIDLFRRASRAYREHEGLAALPRRIAEALAKGGGPAALEHLAERVAAPLVEELYR